MESFSGRAQRQFAGSAPSRRPSARCRPGPADRSPGGRSAPAVPPAFRCIARESARESGRYSLSTVAAVGCCCCVFVRRGGVVSGDAKAAVVAQRRLKWSRLTWSQLRWQRQRNVDRVAAAAAERTGVVHRLRCSLTCCALIYCQAQYFRRQAKQISSVGSLWGEETCL